MTVRSLVKKFDDHCIFYSALVGVILMPFASNPQHQNLLVLPACTAFLGGFCWYILKAIFITGSTIKNWEKTNPGEPMFKAGGLTEYDREFARQVAEAVEAVRRRNDKDGHYE